MRTYFTEKREANEENFCTFSPTNLPTYLNLYLDSPFTLLLQERNYLEIYHLILTYPTYSRKSIHKLSHFYHASIFPPMYHLHQLQLFSILGKKMIPHFLHLQLHFSVPILFYFFLVLGKQQVGECTDGVGGTGMECTGGGCTGGGAKVGWGSQVSHFIPCKKVVYM